LDYILIKLLFLTIYYYGNFLLYLLVKSNIAPYGHILNRKDKNIELGSNLRYTY